MREYDVHLVEKLQKDFKVIENNGVEIILKPSPLEEREGYLDPIEFSIIKENWAGKTEDKTEDNKKNMPTSLELMVASIRDSMGYPNRNLNTVEIHTKYEEITDSGNVVGLWRYYPRKTEKNKKRPALVFIHGGGWIGGSVYTVENFCKLIAELADAVVFNVDYSLAPEKPFPNGLNDNYYAVKHIYDNAESYGINPDKIAVGGDSAGGNYTAAVCLMAREKMTPKIALQVLIYPPVARGDVKVDGYEWSEDFFQIAKEQEEMIRGCLGLGRPQKDISKDLAAYLYLTDKDEVYNHYVSPMLATSHKDLPKALLAGAEFDGLRIQTEFYAKQLKEAGVAITTYRYKGVTHAFIDKLGILPQAEDLCIEIAKALKEM